MIPEGDLAAIEAGYLLQQVPGKISGKERLFFFRRNLKQSGCQVYLDEGILREGKTD
jgi:hypothetical protein